MLNIAFYDIESRKISTDFPDGWGEDVPSFLDSEQRLTNANTFFMEFGVGCICDNDGQRFYEEPVEFLMKLLSNDVDAIISFNGETFDIPLLLGTLEPPTKTEKGWQFSEGFRESYLILGSKSIDLLSEIEKTIGHRVSLDQVTSAMFDMKKEIHGEDWWKMYCAGDLKQRTMAVNYLLADVEKLKMVWACGTELKELAYRDSLGQTSKFSITFPAIVSQK